MTGDEAVIRDHGRREMALQAIREIMIAFEESSETELTLYDLLGDLIDDMVASGGCAACIQDMLTVICKEHDVDTVVHRQGKEAVYH